MRDQDKFVIWPVYFDSTLTRSRGRKLPKTLCVPSPRISELVEAVSRLRLKYELVADASHPRTPWAKTGKLLVVKNGTKNKLLKKIAEQLRRIRASASIQVKR